MQADQGVMVGPGGEGLVEGRQFGLAQAAVVLAGNGRIEKQDLPAVAT